MNKMNYYKTKVLYNGIEEDMIINAHSKQEAFIILVRLYREKLEASKVIIKIRNLTYEEKLLFENSIMAWFRSL